MARWIETAKLAPIYVNEGRSVYNYGKIVTISEQYYT